MRASTSLLAYFEGNRTAVLLGSSGVGKSTIVNALVGEEVLATQEVREDDHRGRHTTSHRELILLPTGGVVLDTPGIRELQLWDADLEQAFGDVEEIARRCRFSDCAHDREPGCAIRDALADGSLARRALAELRQAAARARGDRAEAEPPAATGTRAGVQDSRTSESSQEEALSPPRVREDAVDFALADPEHRFAEVVLGQEVVRPRPGPPFALERRRVAAHLPAAGRRPARVPDRRRRRLRARSGEPAPRAGARSATSP